MIRLLGLFFTLTSALVWGQGTATIVGRVIDSSGAVIVGATVGARNVETGLERATITKDSGDYELPLLPITGSYALTISKPIYIHTGYSIILAEIIFYPLCCTASIPITINRMPSII